MSKKYYEKVLAGSGTSSVKVKSAFGSKILAKYGWKEGDGLGATMSGISECVQVQRRDERMGIGAERKADSEWDDWWSGAYDSVAAKISIKPVASTDTTTSDSDSEKKVSPVSSNHLKRRVKRKLREEAP